MQEVRRTRLDPCRKVRSMAPADNRTIVKLWRDAVSANRTGTAYLAETEPGHWRGVSWNEAACTVDELAHGLLSRGIGQGDAFGIVSRTRLEWTLFDFALALVGGITAPVYPDSSPSEAAHVLRHSEAVGALVEDDGQVAKIEPLGLPHLMTLQDFDDLRADGVAFAQAHPRALDQAAAAVGEDDLLLYLPLAHNFGRLMTLWGAYSGFTIAFCSDPYAVADALPQVRPTLLPSVPRMYEKAHTTITSKLEAASGPRRWLGEWALGVGRRVSALRQQGEPLPQALALQHRIADRVVYSKVKQIGRAHV